MVHRYFSVVARARSGIAWVGLALVLPPACGLAAPLTAGGSLVITSDYIYRGVSESNHAAAVQGDLHVATDGGTFAGLWASTRDEDLDPGGRYDFEIYLGHRFDLGSAWNATLSVRNHYFAGGVYEPSADYQQVVAALGYMDRWTLSLTAIPNAVRYWFFRRLRRAPAWVAETGGQWLLFRGLFATAGAGYYRAEGTGPGIERSTGYAYGNAGLGYEWRAWRVDVGYFVTQAGALRSFPYPSADRRVAGTLTRSF